MKESIHRAYEEIRSRLRRARKRENLAMLLHGTLLWLGGFMGSVVLALLVERSLYLGPTGRTLLFWFLLALAGALFLWRVARPLLMLMGIVKGEDDLVTAQKLGSKLPGIQIGRASCRERVYVLV